VTDLTLPVALVVSVGMNVSLWTRWRRAEKQASANAATAHFAMNRERSLYRVNCALSDELDATRAALAGKVAAEFSGGDGEGPVAA